MGKLKEISKSKEMLSYQKMVIGKVSFSEDLVKKELEKSYSWLNADDFEMLIKWAINELSFMAEKIKEWFSEFFKEKQLLVS